MFDTESSPGAAEPSVADIPWSPHPRHGRSEPTLQALLVAKYATLHRRLTRQLRCADLASESLHDAWLRLGDAAHDRPVQSPEAFVYRVSWNIAMDRLRAARPGDTSTSDDADVEGLVDPAPGPHDVVQARSELRAVDEAFQALPRRHRSILMALRIEELTRQEVAAMHGLSLQRVDTALRQAVEHCSAWRGTRVRKARGFE